MLRIFVGKGVSLNRDETFLSRLFFIEWQENIQDAFYKLSLHEISRFIVIVCFFSGVFDDL